MEKRLLADRVTIVNILAFIPKVADLPLVIQQGDIILIQNKAKNYSTLTSRLMVFDYFIKQSIDVSPFQFQTSYWCSFRTCLQGCIFFLNYEILQPLLGFQYHITQCSVNNLSVCCLSSGKIATVMGL